jgi:glutathione S-transferase
MRQVLGRANSSNVMKVIWLLEELRLPYQREDAGGAFGGTDTPEYLAMNPNGTVPTLVEGDFVLWESNAIVRYLCAANAPGSEMWPDGDLRARASIDRWMDWDGATLVRSQSPLFQGLVRTPPERRDRAAISAAATATARLWGILDTILARVPYVAGPVFTLADIPLGVQVHRWFFFPMDKPDLPHLRAWYDRLLQRPAYRDHCADIPVT